MNKTDSKTFQFSEEDREILEEFGLGFPESTNAIGSPEQVEDYIQCVERLVTDHIKRSQIPALASVHLKEIRRLNKQAKTLRNSLFKATEPTRHWMEDQLQSRLLNRDIAYMIDHAEEGVNRLADFDTFLADFLWAVERIEYSKQPPPAEPSETQVTYNPGLATLEFPPPFEEKPMVGRPENRSELDLVTKMAKEYHRVFNTWPTTYVLGPFVVFVEEIFKTLGQSFDAHHLCRKALARLV